PGADDADGDGVPDLADNCAAAANPDQADHDQDGAGDACDLDDDGDGVVDTSDNCPTTANPGQEDGNDNGVGDACELMTAGARIALGMDFTCFLRDDSRVYCWGDNSQGQLGRGNVGGVGTQPQVVPGLTGVIGVWAGRDYACAAVDAQAT